MTLAELRATLERRAAEAEAIGATAPVAAVYRTLIVELETLNGHADQVKRPEADHLLDADAVAARLGTSVRWVYQHADQLGGRRLSRRCLRFSEPAVSRYLERRR